MNETEARGLCNEQFANSTIYNIVGKPIAAEPYIEDCVLDLIVSKYHDSTYNKLVCNQYIVFAKLVLFTYMLVLLPHYIMSLLHMNYINQI